MDKLIAEYIEILKAVQESIQEVNIDFLEYDYGDWMHLICIIEDNGYNWQFERMHAMAVALTVKEEEE